MYDTKSAFLMGYTPYLQTTDLNNPSVLRKHKSNELKPFETRLTVERWLLQPL